jgi:hypothetical protein
MKGWIKAGLIGAIAGVILTVPAFFLFFLPINIGILINVCTGALFFLLYPCVGVLAAYWSLPPRTSKQGAIDGALGGLLAFGLDSLVSFVMMLIFMLNGIFEQYVRQFAPWTSSDVMQQAMTSTMVVLTISLFINVLAGIFFSAIGGLVLASVKKE